MIKNLQALRGIAALLVLYVHLFYTIGGLCPAFKIPTWLALHDGSVGVDIFFVISGYVISLTAAKKHHNALDFFCARFARVVPLYLFTTLLAILLAQFSTHTSVDWRSLWNGVFYLPLFDFSFYSYPPNVLGWTLSAEMWFYLVFTALLCFWAPGRVSRFLPWFFALGAFLANFYHGAWFFPTFAFYPQVLEFSFGCLIYGAARFITGPTAVSLLVVGLLGLALSNHYVDFNTIGYNPDLRMGWLRVAAWGYPAALIVAGLIGLETSGWLTLPLWLIWLGEISYSFYLVQRFVISLTVATGHVLHFHQPLAVAFLTFVLNFLVAYTCWRLVEKPLTLLTKGFFDRHLALRRARKSNPPPVIFSSP